MSVIATLNVGSNGATSKNGSSAELSSDVDRNSFLALHRSAGAYVLGRTSYLKESYSKSTAPLFILTRSPQGNLSSRGNVTEIDVSEGLIDPMRSIRATAPSPIVVEAGVKLLHALIAQGCIEELHLTISPIVGDGDFLDVETLLNTFQIVSDDMKDSTRMLKCRYQGHSAYSEENS
jgi:dihydrofolate reductase